MNKHSSKNGKNLPSKPPIKPELEQLKSLLNEEIKTYSTVEEKMLQKKNSIVLGDVETLSKLDQELLALNQKAIELEKKRLDLMVQMGHQNKSLKAFISGLDMGNTQVFHEARQKLIQVVDHVHKINAENQSLLKLSLRFIETSVETIAQLLTPESTTYSPKGQKSSSTSSQESNPGQSTIQHSI